MSNELMRLRPGYPIWAIQQKENEHQKWEEKNERTSIIRFEWDEVNIPGLSSHENIAIAVAKAHPEYNHKEILRITSSIYAYSRIKIENGILGITGASTVKRIGFVEDKNLSKRSVELVVKWAHVLSESESSNFPVFDPDKNIQKVSNKILRQLNLPASYFNYESFNEPKEYIFEDKMYEPMNDFFIEEKAEDQGNKIQIFYGTSRSKTGADQLNEFYGSDLDKLKVGTCIVTVPKNHVQGEIERPDDYWVLKFPENPSKHFTLESINELAYAEFYNILKTSNPGSNSTFIFIHGYNTTFAEAAWRTAQIAWDIPFNGKAGFFSWPSNGKVIGYLRDIELADSSVDCFEDFLTGILQNTNITSIHLLAHSMGNRILTQALNRLSQRETFAPYLNSIKQVVLCAPDLDQNVFNKTILPYFKSVGERRTLYCSERDRALAMSERFRKLPRLGDAGNSIFVADGLDTVDASNVPSVGNHHSYIFETKELLGDLHYLLGKGFPPIERRLRAKKKNELIYWLFPA